MQVLKFMRADDHPANGTRLQSEAKLNLSQLLGTWWSTDKATRGIRKLVLSEENGALMVHGFGACAMRLGENRRRSLCGERDFHGCHGLHRTVRFWFYGNYPGRLYERWNP